MNANRVVNRMAIAAIVFGGVTGLTGGRALFGSLESRADFGNAVPVVLWFHFLAGMVYFLAGAGRAGARDGPRGEEDDEGRSGELPGRRQRDDLVLVQEGFARQERLRGAVRGEMAGLLPGGGRGGGRGETGGLRNDHARGREEADDVPRVSALLLGGGQGSGRHRRAGSEQRLVRDRSGQFPAENVE